MAAICDPHPPEVGKERLAALLVLFYLIIITLPCLLHTHTHTHQFASLPNISRPAEPENSREGEGQEVDPPPPSPGTWLGSQESK